MKNKDLARGRETRLRSLEIITLDYYPDNRGELTVIEEKVLPFKIRRMFTVKGSKGAIRAKHAHKECTQFIHCVYGKIEVTCDDGFEKKQILLNTPGEGINVPPGIWLEQTYLEDDSILNVLCDLPYEKDDYMADYNEFKEFKSSIFKV